MTIRHRAESAILALALGAALAGCSPATASPTVSGTVVVVTEDEYSIALTRVQYRPGVYTFEVHNAGGSTHNLRITGPGVDNAETPNIAPDGMVLLTVTLESGEYELYCETSGHREAGMDATISVP